MSFNTRHLGKIIAVGCLLGAVALPQPAAAGWHGGVFIGLPPVVVGPAYVGYPAPYPYYYPPAYYGPGYYGPVVYGPPVASAAPQSTTPEQSKPSSLAQNTPFGQMCHAGVYSCAAPPQTHVGAGCVCPGIGAPSYGTVQ